MMCDFQHSLNMLPERFSVKGFLESVINDEHDDSYTSCIKSAANYAYAHLEVFQLLALIIWYGYLLCLRNICRETGKKSI